MPITSLRFSNVGPFDDVEFEFDEHVNVFTGPNNSGKSTVLWLLGELAVFPFDFPEKLLRKAEARFETTMRVGTEVEELRGTVPMIRGIEHLPAVESIDAWRRWSEVLEGIGYTSFVPALRRSTDYRSEGPSVHRREDVGSRPFRNGDPKLIEKDPQILLERIDRELDKRVALIETNASLVSDEAVIQKIIELDYRAYRRNETGPREVISNIAEIASEITEGFPIRYLRVDEDENGLFPQFRTIDGDVPLNILSQGTQSILQWLAHLLLGYAQYYDYPPNLEDKPGIFIIDEIDAHLHPSWQRRIIPTLTKHFPSLQIFCSTHSPLMLAGLKEGQVQLLRRDESGKVIVSRNETDIIGWSADEILRNFLDVSSPTDLETVKHLERLQELRRKDSLSEQELEELEDIRLRVNQDLTGGPIAAEIDRLADLLKEAKAHVDMPPAPSPSAEPRSNRRRRNRSA